MANRRIRANKNWYGYLFIAPACIALLGLVVYPLLYGIFISFFDTNLVTKWNFVGLKYFAELVQKPDFFHKLGLTFYFTFFVVAGHIFFGVLMAILLNTKVRGRLFFRALLILPWIVPEVVVGTIWKWIYNPMYGLLNNLLMALHIIEEPMLWISDVNLAMPAVIIACIWKGFPMVMMMTLAGLQTISPDYYEAAAIDGASKAKAHWYITMPLLIPVMLVVFVLDTVWWFKHFNIVYVMTGGGPVDATNVVAIDIYRTAFESFQFGRSSAMAVVVMIICFIISAIYRRLLGRESY